MIITAIVAGTSQSIMVGAGAGIVTIHGTTLGITLVIHGVGVIITLGTIIAGAGEAGMAAVGMQVVGTVEAGMAEITIITTQARYTIAEQDVREALTMDLEDIIPMDAIQQTEDIHLVHRMEPAHLIALQVVREPVHHIVVQPMALALLVLHTVMQIPVRQRVLVTIQDHRQALVRAMALLLVQQHVRAIIQGHHRIILRLPVRVMVRLPDLLLVQVIAVVRQVVIQAQDRVIIADLQVRRRDQVIAVHRAVVVRVQDRAIAVRQVAQAHHVRATAAHRAVVVLVQDQPTVARQAVVVRAQAHHVRAIAVRQVAVLAVAPLVPADHLVEVAAVAAAEVVVVEADNEHIS